MTSTDHRLAGAPVPAGRAPQKPRREAAASTQAIGASGVPYPVPTASARSPWEQCDHCRAPIDPQQRYCVECATPQRRTNDPATRFFAAARRPKAPAAVPGADRRTIPVTAAALLIALLPVAAGIGIVVGRGSADSGQQVIEALKAAQLSGSGAVAGTTTGAVAAGPDAVAAAETAKAKADKGDGGKVDGIATQTEKAAILASGPTGSARQLEGNKPTPTDIADSKKAVEQINSRKGKDYVDAQRDLPDTIVIP